MNRATTTTVRLTLFLILALAVQGCGAPGEDTGRSTDNAAPAGGGGGNAMPAAQPQTASAVPAQVTKAAAIAKAIQADPDNADAILEAEGMTQEEFEDLLYEIASDPVMSAAYEAKLGT